MKRTLFFLIICLCLSANAAAQTMSAQDIMQTANERYSDGAYSEAIELYEQLLDSCAIRNDDKAFVYYNLGNAFFRINETGKSILNYERCLRLQPNNKDARYNLKFAQSKIIDNIDDTHTFFLSQWITALRDMVNYRTWMWLSICLFWLCLIAVIVFLFTQPVALRKTGFHIAWLSFVLSVCSFAFATAAHNHRNDNTEAIVMQGIVNVKSSPDRSGTDLFVVHEGTKLRISDRVGEWVEVHVGDNIGWLREDNIERIVN